MDFARANLNTVTGTLKIEFQGPISAGIQDSIARYYGKAASNVTVTAESKFRVDVSNHAVEVTETIPSSNPWDLYLCKGGGACFVSSTETPFPADLLFRAQSLLDGVFPPNIILDPLRDCFFVKGLTHWKIRVVAGVNSFVYDRIELTHAFNGLLLYQDLPNPDAKQVLISIYADDGILIRWFYMEDKPRGNQEEILVVRDNGIRIYFNLKFINRLFFCDYPVDQPDQVVLLPSTSPEHEKVVCPAVLRKLYTKKYKSEKLDITPTFQLAQCKLAITPSLEWAIYKRVDRILNGIVQFPDKVLDYIKKDEKLKMADPNLVELITARWVYDRIAVPTAFKRKDALKFFELSKLWIGSCATESIRLSDFSRRAFDGMPFSVADPTTEFKTPQDALEYMLSQAPEVPAFDVEKVVSEKEQQAFNDYLDLRVFVSFEQGGSLSVVVFRPSQQIP